jgi:hypothetical protein
MKRNEKRLIIYFARGCGEVQQFLELISIWSKKCKKEFLSVELLLLLLPGKNVCGLMTDHSRCAADAFSMLPFFISLWWHVVHSDFICKASFNNKIRRASRDLSDFILY